MNQTQKCLAVLRAQAKPMTNRELAEATYDHSGAVNNAMIQLIKIGVVTRIDGKTGRGTVAVYALKEGSTT